MPGLVDTHLLHGPSNQDHPGRLHCVTICPVHHSLPGLPRYHSTGKTLTATCLPGPLMRTAAWSRGCINPSANSNDHKSASQRLQACLDDEARMRARLSREGYISLVLCALFARRRLSSPGSSPAMTAVCDGPLQRPAQRKGMIFRMMRRKTLRTAAIGALSLRKF